MGRRLRITLASMLLAGCRGKHRSQEMCREAIVTAQMTDDRFGPELAEEVVQRGDSGCIIRKESHQHFLADWMWRGRKEG